MVGRIDMYRGLLLARKLIFRKILRQRRHSYPSLQFTLPTFYRMSLVHAPSLLGRQLLLLLLISPLQLLYPLIVVVYGRCQGLLRSLLANNELIEVLLEDCRCDAWRSDF